MKTDDVLKELRSLLKKRGWSAQIRMSNVVRLRGPDDRSFFRNPLCALAFYLHGTANLKWEVPGETLGLKPSEIENLHLACDFRWLRPLLRMKVLKACGVRDQKFIEAFEFAESVLPKRELERVLSNLSTEDREALESATVRRGQKQIEGILKKSR